MLSILILTHNRPKLFKRCLDSVIKNIPPDLNIEILVNNDSNDITEINHQYVKYFYYKSTNLSDIYKFLFKKASNEYVLFLEDDDYLLKRFFKIVPKYLDKYDLLYMNYIPVDLCDLQLNSFKIETRNNLFQLTQIIFRKKLINVNDFPIDNNIHNDWKLFQTILKNKGITIKKIKVPMFRQTVDGKDNISFKEYNNDKRFN